MREKDISVFVDESGSFESAVDSSRYYLVCLVLHDQDADLSDDVRLLEDSLVALGLDRKHCIHAGPLIRREKEYVNMISSVTRDEVIDAAQKYLVRPARVSLSNKETRE